MASKPIYQIYAELQDYEPKIWRRFQVMNDITMARLGYILMTLLEMQGSHLYLFEVDELNNFIINNLEYYNKHIEDFEDDDFFKIGQYGCIFEEDDIIPRLDKRYRELKDAKDVKLKWVLDKENEIYLITARGENLEFFRGSEKVTKELLENNNIKYTKIIFNAINKAQLCVDNQIDLMIDDSVKFCVDIAKNDMKSILFTSVVNKDEIAEVPRVNSWVELQKEIDNIVK